MSKRRGNPAARRADATVQLLQVAINNDMAAVDRVAKELLRDGGAMEALRLVKAVAWVAGCFANNLNPGDVENVLAQLRDPALAIAAQQAGRSD